jgi:hypothetical protein
MVVGPLADDFQAHERDHELRREGRILQIGVLRGDQSEQSAADDFMGIQPSSRTRSIISSRAGIKMLQEEGAERFPALFVAPKK